MADLRQLLKNWRILLLLAGLLAATISIGFNHLSYGIDFKGGTSFQIKLVKPASDAQQLETIRSIIEQRLDWTGLKDTRVTKIDNDLLVADIAETNPENIARLESLLQKQGNFEATIDGNLLFTGEDIITISKDPSKGYGVIKQESGYRWLLPFMLSNNAAKRFTEMTFHKCTITGIDAAGKKTYDCDKTFFFIDRPTDSVLLIPATTFAKDKESLLAGNRTEDIAENTKIEELLLNAAVPYIVFDENFSTQQIADLNALAKTKTFAIMPVGTSEKIKNEIVSLGLKPKELSIERTVPYTWVASGAKQIIFLSEDVTNLEPYVADVKDAKIYGELVIRGFGTDAKEAQKRLQDLTILLESGSLPIGVESISKETIPPTLGKEFLNQSAIMGLIALFTVSLIIFIRYRQLKLVIPIMCTAIFEVFLVLGFAAAISWNLDLASIAGIVAAVGTGVNDQIVITDELLKGAADSANSGSLSTRVKRAFFIIMAAASTAIATMLPIFFLGSGLGKLVGFAITTIAGVIAGVVFTRPAYGEVAKILLQKD